MNIISEAKDNSNICKLNINYVRVLCWDNFYYYYKAAGKHIISEENIKLTGASDSVYTRS